MIIYCVIRVIIGESYYGGRNNQEYLCQYFHYAVHNMKSSVLFEYNKNVVI